MSEHEPTNEKANDDLLRQRLESLDQSFEGNALILARGLASIRSRRRIGTLRLLAGVCFVGFLAFGFCWSPDRSQPRQTVTRVSGSIKKREPESEKERLSTLDQAIQKNKRLELQQARLNQLQEKIAKLKAIQSQQQLNLIRGKVSRSGEVSHTSIAYEF